MKDLGYGKGYQYAHNQPQALVSHSHLPEQLTGTSFYRPAQSGYEKTIKERLDWLTEKKKTRDPRNEGNQDN